MAGKTFPGIGDLEDESLDPADAEDTGATPAPGGPYYSGPTVVDDAKVEEGLQKLRSLDAPPTEIAAAEDSAGELIESGRHGMPAFVPGFPKDGGRETFIGHSIAQPLPAPAPEEKPYDDRMRGTLYGHMLHLPELNLPAPEEPSERALTIVDRNAPTSQAVEVYRPEAARRAAAAIPQEAEAFPRSDRYRSIPIELDDAVPKDKTLLRVGIAAAAIAAIIGAALIWLHNTSQEPDVPPRPAAAAQPAEPPPAVPAPPVAPPPPAARPTAETGSLDSAGSKPGRDVARPSTERARSLAVRPATTPPPAAAARPEHRRASPSAEPRDEPAPAKRKPSKRQTQEDDPDGTLAPSIE